MLPSDICQHIKVVNQLPNRPPLEPATSYHPRDYGQAKRLYEQALGTRGIGRTDEDLGITPGTQAATNTLEMPASVSPVTPVAAGPAASGSDPIADFMRRTDPSRLLEPDHPFAKAFAAMTPSMKSNYAMALLHNSVGIGGVPRNENPFRDAYLTEKYGPEMTGEAEMIRLLDKYNRGDTEGLDAGENMFGWGNKAAGGLDLMNLSSRAQGDGGGDSAGRDGGDGGHNDGEDISGINVNPPQQDSIEQIGSNSPQPAKTIGEAGPDAHRKPDGSIDFDKEAIKPVFMDDLALAMILSRFLLQGINAALGSAGFAAAKKIGIYEAKKIKEGIKK